MAKQSSKRTYSVPTRAAKPEVNRVLRLLRSMGLLLEFSAGAGHWRVIDPGTGAFLTTVSGTPSDVNWWHNVRRAVEKAGFPWGSKAPKRKKHTGSSGIAQVDLEALGHAQRMARLHGEREPRIEDLDDKAFLVKIRKGYDDKQSEEAIQQMAHGVESARAHRVVSRLLYMVEQHGDEMRKRAKERNPKVRDGVANELMYISAEVAKKRGLRYWKSPESAYNTFITLLSGTSSGMSIWVANLLEATMDEIDGLRWDPIGGAAKSVTPAESIEQKVGKFGAPIVTMAEAKQLILDVLTAEWTLRTEIHSALVPEQMADKKFHEGLSELVRDGLIEREREKKKQGSMLYRLAGAITEPEPTEEPEPESEPLPTPKPEPTELPEIRLSQGEVASIIYGHVSADWTLRSDLWALALEKGATSRVFERALLRLVNQGLLNRERLPDGRTRYCKTTKSAVLSTDGPIAVETQTPPEPKFESIEAPTPRPRSIVEAMTGSSIADRYADALLSKLAEVNGSADWAAMEPILSRLDRLAGIGVGDNE